jgi:cysteine desulfurase
MTSDSIYLDYAATTPIDPAALAAMVRCHGEVGANPASLHAAGRRARRLLEDAAESIGRMLGAQVDQVPADRVLLTSGGTEANNLALLGLASTCERRPGRIIVSTIEHPSVLAAAAQLARRGWRVDHLRVLGQGMVDLDHLDELLAEPGEPPECVSVMLANNETGVLQPVAEVVRRCRPRGIPVHTDAVQAIGKVPVSFRELGVATMTIAAHKFHGPAGIGALVMDAAARRSPILFGGSQQLGLRPGTEPVALTVGMEHALRQWFVPGQERCRRLAECRNLLETRLTDEAGALVNGSGPRVPQTLNVSFPGIERQALLLALDFAGVYASSGSACASGSSEPSPVLQAMGLPMARVESAIRLSVGLPSTIDQMNQAADRILKAVNQLRL